MVEFDFRWDYWWGFDVWYCVLFVIRLKLGD